MSLIDFLKRKNGIMLIFHFIMVMVKISKNLIINAEQLPKFYLLIKDLLEILAKIIVIMILIGKLLFVTGHKMFMM